MAQPAEVLDLLLTPDVFQVPTDPENLTRQAVAATSRSSHLLVLCEGSLSGWCLGANGAPDGNSAESFAVKESPPLGNLLGDAG